MAVVVLNYPVTMRSLSETALKNTQAKQHRIEKIIGLSAERPVYGQPVLGAYNVWTVCGSQVDAYPEGSQPSRPCASCARSTKKDVPDIFLIRLMPPVGDPDSGWHQAYWRALTPDRDDDVPGSPGRTDLLTLHE